MRNLILIICLALITNSCLVSDSESVDKAEISDIIRGIEYAFFNWDMEAILKNYHEDFLHNGYNKLNIRTEWEFKNSIYERFTIQDMDISKISSNTAIVRMKIYFYDYRNDNYSSFLLEPEQEGYLSYFFRDEGKWYIYGNQEYRN